VASQVELLIEANCRGALPPDKKAAFNEAVRRGLITLPEKEQSQRKRTFNMRMPDGTLIKDVPEDATREQLLAIGKRYGAADIVQQEKGARATPTRKEILQELSKRDLPPEKQAIVQELLRRELAPNTESEVTPNIDFRPTPIDFQPTNQADVGQFRAGMEEELLGLGREAREDPRTAVNPRTDVDRQRVEALGGLARFTPNALLEEVGSLPLRGLQALGRFVSEGLTGSSPEELIKKRLESLPPAPAPGEEGRFGRTAGRITGAGLPFAPLGFAGGLRAGLTELGTNVLSGVTGAAGEQIAGLPGQIIGTLTPAAARVGLQTGIRGALRGGEQGRRQLSETVRAFESAGTKGPTLSQAVGGVAVPNIEKGISRLPLGGRILKDLRQQELDIAKRIERISEGVSPGALPESAGIAVRAGIRDFARRAQARVGAAWRTLDNFVDPQRPIATRNLRAVTEEIAGEITAPGGQKIFRSLDSPFLSDAREAAAFSELPYKTLKRLRNKIGRQLGDPQLVSDLPRGDLKRIYGALTQDMKAAAAAEGPDALRAWQRANELTKRQHQVVDDFLQRLSNKLEDSKIFEDLFSGTQQAPRKVRAVMANLRSEERQQFVGALLKRMADPTRTGEQVNSITTFARNYRKMPSSVRRAVFGRAEFGTLQRDVEDVVSTVERINEIAKVGANPSGTAGAALRDFVSGAGLTAGFFYSPFVLAGAAIPPAVNRLLTSQGFIRWLARSTRIPARQVPAHIARLSVVVRGEPVEVQEAAREYLNALRSPSTGQRLQ
jgi:hypothetical protein